ncbi:EboA domain-containing protein [Pedobacter sp. Leaf176]|uniref:EboA domain-containing protein n=1 Tax=Pedobacter sp. Leaf176 TaxID=1736286 RepID=UPI0007007C9F|nr:EboA domain-containing protein [Pedobacter sp. Leaf176]KQR69627.1 hypothetical protein ASF92_12995 [Pedobacter sp. Leaf176]
MAIGDDFGNINELLSNIIKDNTDETAFKWLLKAASADEISKLGQAFVMLPRKTGKTTLRISELQKLRAEEVGIGYVTDWRIDRLARVWLLSVHSFADAEKSHRLIEQLFLAPEMNEAEALYSALPFLAKPETWVKRCAEGIRSNIGSVLESIMENNPYPSKYLNEAAWNQLVLKAFFTEKNISKINGLDERANKQLALTLSDYARERYAAGRQVNPQLWRLAGPFIDGQIFDAIKIGLNNHDRLEHEAIALAISESDYEPAKAYISQIPELSTLSK